MMLEGKTDYYVLQYFNSLYHGARDVKLLPGGGSGSLSNVIRLYIAWGRNFFVLLDGDKEGKKASDLYLEEFGPAIKDRISLLSDIDANWKGFGIEKIILEDDRMRIQKEIFPDEQKYSKKRYNIAIQELYVTNRKIAEISNETIINTKKILDFYVDKIK
jgi:hypothetical protein